MSHIHQILDANEAETVTLDVLQQYIADCCIEKKTSIFIQNRLKIKKGEPDKDEVHRFFLQVFENIEDTEFDRVAKNQNGNFVIQQLIELSHKLFANEVNLSEAIKRRIVPKLQDYVKHKFASRIV